MCAQSFKTRLKATFPVMIGADENITLVLNTKWHGTYIDIHPDHGNITQYTRMHPCRFCVITSTIDKVIHIHSCQSLYYLCLITIGMYNIFSLSAVSLQLVHHQYHHNLYFTSIIIILTILYFYL